MLIGCSRLVLVVLEGSWCFLVVLDSFFLWLLLVPACSRSFFVVLGGSWLFLLVLGGSWCF